MKNFKVLFITTTLLLSALTIAASAEQQPFITASSTTAVTTQDINHPIPDSISISIDGKTIKLNQMPVIENQRVLIPLRSVCETLGCRVQWEPDTQSIFIQKRDQYISLTLGDCTMYVNDTSYPMDVPPEVKNGSTWVPVRFLAKAIDADIKWVPSAQSVMITTAQGDHHITDQWNSYSVYDEPTGITLYTENTVYPVLDNDQNDVAITKINETVKKAVDNIVQTNEKSLIENAREMLGTEGFHTTSLNMEMTIPYDKNDRLSVFYTISTDFGGAHPSSYVEAYNFNTKDGSELKLSDVLGCTEQEALQKVREAFIADISTKPDTYFEDAKTTAAGLTEDDFVWTLTDNGIAIYVQRYTLAPYASGFPSITIPFKS